MSDLSQRQGHKVDYDKSLKHILTSSVKKHGFPYLSLLANCNFIQYLEFRIKLYSITT